MPFYVISEPIYNTSSWHRSIMDGLIEIQRKKRFSLEFLTNINELKRFSVCKDDAIFIIGANSEWLNTTITACSPFFGNRIIILGNHSLIPDGKRYSTVMADISGNITVLYSYLKAHGKNRIAMYGINPASASDKLRTECFLECGGTKNDLFYNDTSLLQCFNSFSEKIEEYDGVICVNDYAAISFIKHLNDSNTQSRLFVTSCGTSLLARLSAPSITHTQVEYKKFADSAYELYKLLLKNENISSVTVQLTCNFVIGETTDFLPIPDSSMCNVNVMDKKMDIYYSDLEIKEMMKAETLLSTCDDIDLLIIERLLDNFSFAKIADELFISQSTMKYKIKKMYKICEVDTKDDFVAMLGKYIKIRF